MAVVSTLIFAVGLFVFLQNPRNPANIFFFLFCLSLNLWLYGRMWLYCTKDAVLALWIARHISKLGVVYIAPMVYAFSVFWLNLYEKRKKWVISGLLIAPVFYLLTIFTPYGMPEVRRYFWGYYPVYGPVLKVFLGFFFFYFLAAFYNFLSAHRMSKDPIRKKQIQLVTVAYAISITASWDYIPKIVNIPLYPFGYISVLFWTLVLAYSIVRYRVLDIQTVIHKTIMWLLASSVLGIPVILFYYSQKEWVYHLPTPLFILLVTTTFLFVVLYTRHVQPRIDHFFQRRQWDLTQALERFTDELVHFKSLEEVISHTVGTLKTVLYATQATVLLRDPDRGIFKLATGLKGAEQMTPFSLDSPFLEWLESNDTMVQAEYLDLDPSLKEVAAEGHRYFNHFHAVICVPLVVNQKLLGVLNIGAKQNLQRFRLPEFSFLSDFRRAAAIALSNSLHLIQMQENLRRWNEELEKKVEERTRQLETAQAQLVQAEKLATIGNLAGGVAHEINNPLTAVLTNAQILKMTANPDDLESISLIEEGAKRCQTIIQSLLKYARKSGGAESPHVSVHLGEVIQSVCSLLAYQLKQENIDVSLRLGRIPPIEGVSNELEQVLTNLIVNSRDAIRAQGHPGKIVIETQPFNGRVQVKVSDNGHGISKEIIGKIFDPFFTTKDVGSGTGLGLAVSHSIMEKHRGKIHVESKEGVGTTFVLEFPAAK